MSVRKEEVEWSENMALFKERDKKLQYLKKAKKAYGRDDDGNEDESSGQKPLPIEDAKPAKAVSYVQGQLPPIFHALCGYKLKVESPSGCLESFYVPLAFQVL